MKAWIISLVCGVGAGVIYALLDVHSPAPPVVALLGLFGMLVGEQLIPVGRRLLSREPLTLAREGRSRRLMIYQRNNSMTLPWRIAIIDDERSVRSGLSNLLESEGYSTDTFDSAEVFLSHPLALSGAALVITDIKLRGMSGLELFDKLRLLAVPPPPVLFISGHADENMQRYALGLGAAAFLRKPINIDILLDHIQRELARRQ